MPDLPAIDEITASHAVFSSNARRVELTPALAQFLRIAKVEGVRPILRTRVGTELSAHLVAELFAHGASWVTRVPDGPVFDALSARVLTSYDDLVDQAALLRRPPITLPDERWVPSYGALNVEVILHHRPSARVEVGGVVEQVFDALGSQPPDAWGSFEPLTGLWNLTEVTERARREMPSSTVMRITSPDGNWATLQYERGRAGVSERMRGGVLVGAYPDAAASAFARATDLLRRLDRSSSVVAGMVSLVDVDARNTTLVRVRRPEVPLAILAGPWTINEARIDVDSMVRHGAELLGRRAVPSLLVGLQGPHAAPWRNLTELMSMVGWDNLAHAFGLDGQESRG